MSDPEKLRELSDAATPGPWRLKDRGPAHDFDPVHHIVAGEGPYPGATARASFEDAAFIVAAVNYVRTILSQPETLDAAWKEAEAALPEGWGIQIIPGQPEAWEAGVIRDIPNRRYPRGSGRGPTPAAALQALASRLKEGKE